MFGLPRLAPKLSQQQLESQVMPAYRKLTKDRVWLVRAASASTLPAIAGFLPAGEASTGSSHRMQETCNGWLCFCTV